MSLFSIVDPGAVRGQRRFRSSVPAPTMVFPDMVTFAAAKSRTAVPALLAARKPLPWMVLSVSEPPVPPSPELHAVLRVHPRRQLVRRTDRAPRNVHRHECPGGDQPTPLVAADGRVGDGDRPGGTGDGVGADAKPAGLRCAGSCPATVTLSTVPPASTKKMPVRSVPLAPPNSPMIVRFRTFMVVAPARS